MPMRLPSPRELLSNLTNPINGQNNKKNRKGGGGPPTGKVFEPDDDGARRRQQQHELPKTRSRVNLHAGRKKQHVGLTSPYRAKKVLQKLGSPLTSPLRGRPKPSQDADAAADGQKPTHHRFRTIRKVGAGTFSTVHLATHLQTEQPVALKVLSRRKIASLKTADRVTAEIDHLRLCAAHPHIARLYDTIDAPAAPTLDLVMEYVSGGDMYDYLRSRKRRLQPHRGKKGRGSSSSSSSWWAAWGRRGSRAGGLAEADARRYFQQLLSAIGFMHSRGVVHRDLKLENVLLDATHRYVKLADFGLSARVVDGATDRLVTPCGSPHYAAPEIIVGLPYLGPPTDVWSCGVILYALLTGKLPFVESDMRKQFRKIKAGDYSIPSYLSREARNMIGKMMTVRVDRRLTVETVWQHLWFQEGLPEYLNCTPEETERRERRSIDEEVIEEVLDLYGFEGRTNGAVASGSAGRGGVSGNACADDAKAGSDRGGEDLSRTGLERAIALGGGLDNSMTARTGYGETMRDAHTAYQLLLDAKHNKERSEELFGADASIASSGKRPGLFSRCFRGRGIVAIMVCFTLTICTASNVCSRNGRFGIEQNNVLARVREGLGLGNVTFGTSIFESKRRVKTPIPWLTSNP